MSSQQEKQSTIDKQLERDIVRYLRDNPDFFERHLDLLAGMLIPHEAGGTVSLIERQVSVLREQKDEAKSRLQSLIQNAQANELLNQKLNSLVLALLDTSELEQILEVIQQRISKDFNADAVVLRLFNTGHPTLQSRPELVDWSEPAMGAFEKVIAERKPVCGSLKSGQLESLFNDAADTIHSAALIPLVENTDSKKCYGLLAIGSHDPQRFRADMGTLFLAHLGKVLSRVLRLHLA